MTTEIDESAISFKRNIEKLGEIVETGDISPRLLTVAPTNVRKSKISEVEKEELNESVGNVGIAEPIIINLDNEIVSGQLRWESALANNLDTIPYIRMKFKDAFSERACSVLGDAQHHSYDQYDLYTFVKTSREVDNKSYETIAKATGMHLETIRRWGNCLNVPNAIADNKDAVDKYLDMSQKKRMAINSILKKPQYQDDPIKALEIIEYANEAPVRDIQNTRKDINAGTPVNAKVRLQRLGEITTTIEIKIPKSLDKSFRDKLKITGEDPTVVIHDMIQQYVRS